MDTRHRNIKNTFEDVFRHNGLVSFPGSSLFSDDETVYFACATITPLKKIIESNKINQGLYVHQPCLRLQTLNNPFAKSESYQFPGYFNMLGTLISKEQVIPFQNAIVELFDCLGVPKNELKIFSPTTSIPIASELQKQYFTEFDTKSNQYYQWTYGFKQNIYGLGLTFSIRQSDNSYRDIGQYVAILKDGEVIGAEFGFGIETFLAATQKLSNPYLAYSIATALQSSGIEQNFVSTNVISMVGALYSTGLSLNQAPSKGYKRILNRSLNNLYFFSDQYAVNAHQIKDALYHFMKIEFKSFSGFDAFCVDYDEKHKIYIENIKKRDDYIKNQRSLGQSPQYISKRIQQLYPTLHHYEKIRE